MESKRHGGEIVADVLKVGFTLYSRLIEPRHERTGFSPMRKQRRSSAVQ